MTLESVEAEQVLGEDEQAGFGAGAGEAATVKPLQTAVVSGVSKAEFHCRTTSRVPRLNFRIRHLRTLSIQSFLSFKTLDHPTRRTASKTLGSQWTASAVNRSALITRLPERLPSKTLFSFST